MKHSSNPSFCFVVLRFLKEPQNNDEAIDDISRIISVVNNCSAGAGVQATCLAVSRWNSNEALATFLVIDKKGDDLNVGSVFRHALVAACLSGKLALLDRRERLTRAGN